MGLFNGIFDSMSNNLDNFFEGNDSFSTYATAGKDVLALGASTLGGGGQVASDKGEAEAMKGERFSNLISSHTINPLSRIKSDEAIHSHNQFQATDSVDPMTLENEWNVRLKRYADITRETGVSQTGR